MISENIQCHSTVQSLIVSRGGGQTEPRCFSVAMTVESLSDDQSASYIIFHSFFVESVNVHVLCFVCFV